MNDFPAMQSSIILPANPPSSNYRLSASVLADPIGHFIPTPCTTVHYCPSGTLTITITPRHTFSSQSLSRLRNRHILYLDPTSARRVSLGFSQVTIVGRLHRHRSPQSLPLSPVSLPSQSLLPTARSHNTNQIAARYRVLVVIPIAYKDALCYL